MDKFEKLTRAELKKVLGGTVVNPCHSDCSTDDDCKNSVSKTCKDTSSDLCPSRKSCGEI